MLVESVTAYSCIGRNWPTVSGGRWPFRPAPNGKPRLKRRIINKLMIIKFDDWTFEPRPKWLTAICSRPKCRRPPKTGGHLRLYTVTF